MITTQQPTSLKRKVLVEQVDTPRSKLVAYLVYHFPTHTLKVRYRKGKHAGRLRCYEGVTAQEYEDLLESASIGKEVLHLARKYSKHQPLWRRLLGFFRSDSPVY